MATTSGGVRAQTSEPVPGTGREAQRSRRGFIDFIVALDTTPAPGGQAK